MTEIGNIISNAFPPGINKTSNYFSKLIANYKINDIDNISIKKLGLMERLIYDASLYCQKIYGTTDFFNFDVDTMDELENYLFKHVLSYFCLPSVKYFRTERVMQICKLLFQRDGKSGWGTRANLQYIFKELFNCDVYIVENGLTYADSLIKNGDFEKGITDWTSNVEDPISETNPFCGNYSIELFTNEYVSQSLLLKENEKYNFMFFLLGKASVQIINNLNEYWDIESSSWVGVEKEVIFNTSNYENVCVNFSTHKEANSITFKIKSLMDSSCVDYVRLFELNYPCFNVLLRTVIETVDDSTDMVLGPDSEFPDKVPGLENAYNVNYGYLSPNDDKKYYSFYTGTDSGFSKGLQDFVLDYLRAAGVRGVYERVTINAIKHEAYIDGKTLVVPYGTINDETFSNTKDVTDKTFNA